MLIQGCHDSIKCTLSEPFSWDPAILGSDALCSETQFHAVKCKFHSYQVLHSRLRDFAFVSTCAHFRDMRDVLLEQLLHDLSCCNSVALLKLPSLPVPASLTQSSRSPRPPNPKS